MAKIYYNFKNIVDDFKLLQSKHLQLNSFGIGDIKDLIFLTQQKTDEDYVGKVATDNTKNNAPEYPLLYIVPQPATRYDGYITYTFNVIVCDIDNTKNKDIQVDLWSDTLEIAEDILAQFKYSVIASQGDYASKYDITLPTTISPFSESYEDLLVGWNLQLRVLVDKPLNRCIAPYSDFEA